MTTIEKLQIQGIRSFSPANSRNVIEFYKPLTIIVGHNGAGKTVGCLFCFCFVLFCLGFCCCFLFPLLTLSSPPDHY